MVGRDFCRKQTARQIIIIIGDFHFLEEHDPKKVLRARFPLPVAAPVTLRASQPSEATILVNPSAYDATAAPGPDVQTVCNASVCRRRSRGVGLWLLHSLLVQDLHHDTQ